MTRRILVHLDARLPGGARASGVIVEGGRIGWVGEEAGAFAEARRSGLAPIDCGGRTLVAGFIDAHAHFIHEGIMKARLDLSAATSLDDAFLRLAAFARSHPNLGVIIAERFDESRWPERRFPTRSEIDGVVRTRPVLLRRVCGHHAVANSALLERYDESWPGVDRASGHLEEEPSLYFHRVVTPTAPELREALAEATRKAHRLGVTSVQDYAHPHHLEAYLAARGRGALGVRVTASTYSDYLPHLARMGFRTGEGDAWFRFGGMKVFSDGSLGGRTAALKEPYADAPETSGRLTFPPERLRAMMLKAHAAGIQLHVHAIGDRAIAEGTRAYAAIDRGDPGAVRARRHRFEHYELPWPEDAEAARDIGLVLSVQPNFVGEWSAHGGMYNDRLGDERLALTNRFADLAREGQRLAFGSDCMPFSPLHGIDSVLAAPFPAQRLSFDSALEAYTLGAAAAAGEETVKGSIEKGKFADLVLLERNVDEHLAARRRVKDLGVAWTMLDGRIVHEAEHAAA